MSYNFNEGSGNIVKDLSGEGHNGIVNSATWNPTGGIDGSGAHFFDGTRSYITPGKGIFPDVQNTFTMEFWAYPLSTRAITPQSNIGNYGTNGQRYAIYPEHGDTSYGIGHAGAGVSVGTNGVSVFEHADSYMPSPVIYNNPISGWTHIAVVYTNREPSLYINGFLVGEGTPSEKIIHPSPFIGDVYGKNYGTFHGYIDDLSIYNRALSAKEIRDIYKKNPSPQITSTIVLSSQNTVSPITISPAGQVPITNSGDSGVYLPVIIFLIIILCAGGVYGLYMIRKKNSGDVTYTEQKPLTKSTSSDSTADNATKFRSSSFEPESKHHDIFISYSSEDKPIADAICNHLESRHIRCWVAPRDILPGMNYQEAIIDAIDSSSIMVLVFSSHSNTSPHVLTEVNEAMSNGVIIIPFRIENILPSKAMKYLISGPHWLDAMTPPLEQHIQELEETIRILIEKERKMQKGQ